MSDSLTLVRTEHQEMTWVRALKKTAECKEYQWHVIAGRYSLEWRSWTHSRPVGCPQMTRGRMLENLLSPVKAFQGEMACFFVFGDF